MEVDGTPYQILIDTKAILSTLNPTCSGGYRWDPKKIVRRQQKVRLLTKVCSLGTL